VIAQHQMRRYYEIIQARCLVTSDLIPTRKYQLVTQGFPAHTNYSIPTIAILASEPLLNPFKGIYLKVGVTIEYPHDHKNECYQEPLQQWNSINPIAMVNTAIQQY